MTYRRFVGLLLVLVQLVGLSTANASLITTSASGNLMFEYLGGEAGASIQEFGLGTSAENSSIGDRNTVFVIDYHRPPTELPIVNKGYFWSGSQLDFYNRSDYLGDLYAFSSRLMSAPTQADVAVFTDTDNSLRLGGGVVESIGGHQWILHLDDAWSYRFDDDDNEMVIRVWIDQSATLPANAPEPAMWAMLVAVAMAGMAASLLRRCKKTRLPSCGGAM
ncbi:MAG TPA: PEP-CTERM sorting domain-containing protein [Accumulibacter sp.]|uniref:PEP-CTERM sorting domain-containing protein n=1 Tax=Accumulibacter sp. TaxID=2053492 RepID=UPI002C10A698|nr:PEP-CTERM sorting domain-containing protein [Accumulibacter sp.]HRD89845.1 PEP-CTERM sorting domain-containing protein [Accumulibacter sp.]